MPFVAKNCDTDEVVITNDADPLANFACLDCDQTVAYVREHHREGVDGTVSAFFRYDNCGHLGITPSEPDYNSSGGGGTGESKIHKRRKWTALQVALNRFDHSDYSTEKHIGSKRADAVLEFDEPHEEYGRGLVIEYQHKNESKDIVKTERHFAEYEYTTLWLWEDQFKSLDGVPEVDLFDGRVCTPWPYAVPKQSDWTPYTEFVTPQDAQFENYQLQALDTEIPANFPKHWFKQQPQDYWESEGWDAAFRSPDGRYAEKNHVASGLVASLPASTKPTASVPEPARDRLLYDSDRWVRQEHDNAEVSQPLVFDPSLPFSFLFEHLSNADKVVTADISRPPTRFDDVQCIACGNYQYAPNAGLLCPTCGKPYDWEWNVDTGRIKQESIPDNPPVR